MRRETDQGVGAEQAARFLRRGVAVAEVHAGDAQVEQGGADVDAVVDEHQGAVP
jgi:hypothetical protein